MFGRDDLRATLRTLNGLRCVRGNPFVRATAMFGRRLPWIRNRPLRLAWRGRSFRARPVDVHGSVISVLVRREHDGLFDRLTDHGPLVVVDAGANIGAFALLIKSEFPSARVVSVEASSATYRLLSENVRRSGWPGWEAHHCALWDRNGVVDFADDGFASANGSVVGGRALGDDEAIRSCTVVPARRLDALLDEILPGSRISLLKLDIEGAEERVLASVRGRMSMIDAVVIEIHADLVDEARVLALLADEFPEIERLPTSEETERLYFAHR